MAQTTQRIRQSAIQAVIIQIQNNHMTQLIRANGRCIRAQNALPHPACCRLVSTTTTAATAARVEEVLARRTALGEVPVRAVRGLVLSPQPGGVSSSAGVQLMQCGHFCYREPSTVDVVAVQEEHQSWDEHV